MDEAEVVAAAILDAISGLKRSTVPLGPAKRVKLVSLELNLQQIHAQRGNWQ